MLEDGLAIHVAAARALSMACLSARWDPFPLGHIPQGRQDTLAFRVELFVRRYTVDTRRGYGRARLNTARRIAVGMACDG